MPRSAAASGRRSCQNHPGHGGRASLQSPRPLAPAPNPHDKVCGAVPAAQGGSNGAATRGPSNKKRAEVASLDPGPKKGDRLMISLRVDAKDRIWGSLADEKIFKSLSKYGTEEMKNKDVIGTAYRLKLTGTYVLTEDFYLGFIHPSERYNEPRLGEQIKGRVIGVRPDGVLNLSLKPRAYEAISDDAQMILTILERSADQQINFTDKSDPEEIMKAFGISKGAFKRALGNLLKQGLIKQENGVTKLVKKSN